MSLPNNNMTLLNHLFHVNLQDGGTAACASTSLRQKEKKSRRQGKKDRKEDVLAYPVDLHERGD
jgi:hypothetical protein